MSDELVDRAFFHFYFLDGGSLHITGDSCKHYSGHAVITNAKIVNADFPGSNLDGYLDGKEYQRFNVGLYGLRCMIPEPL